MVSLPVHTQQDSRTEPQWPILGRTWKGMRKAGVTATLAALCLVVTWTLSMSGGSTEFAYAGASANGVFDRHLLSQSFVNIDCSELRKIPVADRCEFVLQCTQTRGYINFLAIHECALAAAPAVSFIFQFLFLVFCFMFLGQSAEDYFCPTLEWAADVLHMSHNTAGVTILAFGNAAADISSTMVGISHGAVSLAFGGVIGSAVFVSTLVIGLVIIVRPDFKVFRRPFIRDVVYYILCIGFFTLILFDGHIYAWEAILLMSLYFIYVAIVLLGRKFYQDRKKRRAFRQQVLEQTIAGGMGLAVDIPAPKGKEKGTDKKSKKGSMETPLLSDEGTTGSEMPASGAVPEISVTQVDAAVEDGPRPKQKLTDRSVSVSVSGTAISAVDIDDMKQIDRSRALSERISARLMAGSGNRGGVTRDDSVDVDESELDDLALMISNIDVHHALEAMPEAIEVEMGYSVEEDEDESPEDAYERKVSPLSIGWLHLFRRRFLKLTRWPVDESWSTQILYTFAGPIDFICRATIPLVGEESWNRWLAMWHILACPVLFIEFVGLWNINAGIPLWALVLIIFGMLAIVLFFLTRGEPKVEKWSVFFGLLSFVMAIAWMYIAARELVALLLTFGILTGLSPTILGIILAWGNSLGDFFADVMIARAGNPLMGFSAAISGPTINLLIGVGGSFTFTTLTQKNPYPIVMNIENWVIVGFVFLSYFSTLIAVIGSKWYVKKWYGWYLVIVYLAFLLLSVLLEVF